MQSIDGRPLDEHDYCQLLMDRAVEGARVKAQYKLKSKRPDIAVKWRKWTFGFWSDPENWTFFGIDFGPLEVVWRYEGYRQ